MTWTDRTVGRICESDDETARPAAPRTIGIFSESPDMRFLGFSDGHLKDAMAGFAIHLLASGANIAYGGDLGIAASPV